MQVLRTTLLVLSLAAAGGCSSLDFKAIGKEEIRNAQGHVIGYRERLCDCDAGEELDRVVLYTPRRDDRGKVTAYEERVKGGAILRGLDGRRIGTRYADLRSRGTNPRNSGLTIVFVRPDAQDERVALAKITIEDIKQHLGIAN